MQHGENIYTFLEESVTPQKGVCARVRACLFVFKMSCRWLGQVARKRMNSTDFSCWLVCTVFLFTFLLHRELVPLLRECCLFTDPTKSLTRQTQCCGATIQKDKGFRLSGQKVYTLFCSVMSKKRASFLEVTNLQMIQGKNSPPE